MIVIDGSYLIAGRLASLAAKKALLGEEVAIVNSENVVITGRKEDIFGKYAHKIERGTSFKGPLQPKRADRILRRIVRGMLPYKQERGKIAYKRVMCYLSVPEELKDNKMESIDSINVLKKRKLKYMTLGKLASLL